jgi:hypothetical protein
MMIGPAMNDRHEWAFYGRNGYCRKDGLCSASASEQYDDIKIIGLYSGTGKSTYESLAICRMPLPFVSVASNRINGCKAVATD